MGWSRVLTPVLPEHTLKPGTSSHGNLDHDRHHRHYHPQWILPYLKRKTRVSGGKVRNQKSNFKLRLVCLMSFHVRRTLFNLVLCWLFQFLEKLVVKNGGPSGSPLWMTSLPHIRRSRKGWVIVRTMLNDSNLFCTSYTRIYIVSVGQNLWQGVEQKGKLNQ